MSLLDQRALRGARDVQDDVQARQSHRVRSPNVRIWHLVIEESVASGPYLQRGDRISGQFIAQDMSHDISSNIVEGGGFSRTDPIIQWIGGKLETVSFAARLFSEHSRDFTATNKLEEIKLLTKAHPPFNRPPLTRFFWGNVIPQGMLCFVDSIGGIKYDEIRQDGSIHGLTLGLTLKKFTEFRVERNVVSQMEQTPVHVVRSGETYEMVAQRHYGDALLGVLLRRINPRYPMEEWAPRGVSDLAANEVIKLYSQSELDDEKILPESHIFDENDQISQENRRYYFRKRGQRTAVMPRR